jgi:hypothetical protein
LITLYSIGYIHGDVAPGNVGFNEELRIWQLFDFDNARPIEEAARGKGPVPEGMGNLVKLHRAGEVIIKAQRASRVKII